MITIAAVTMAFLPGTFICTVVSTNFFDYGEQGLQVPRQVVVLNATGVPLTTIVFSIWWNLQNMRGAEQKVRDVNKKLDLKKHEIES